MYTDALRNQISQVPEKITTASTSSIAFKVKGIKQNQAFEKYFDTEQEARRFIEGFTFALTKNFV